jgi:hypothetical protein
MNFDSFIITRKSILAHSVSDLYSQKSMSRYEASEVRKSMSIARDSKWFYEDFITVPEVMNAIP